MNTPDDQPERPTTSNFERRLGEQLALLAAAREAERRPAAAPLHDAFRAGRPVFRLAAGFRHRRLPLAVAGVVAAAVGAVALPSALSADEGGSAAFAVSRGSDGTVAVRVDDPAALPAAVAALRADGINAVALEATAVPGACSTPAPKGPSAQSIWAHPGDAPGTVRIDPAAIPTGQTLLLIHGTQHFPGNATAFLFYTRVVTTVPACVEDTSVQGPVPVSGVPAAPPSGHPDTRLVPPSGVSSPVG
ncbi:hypothetical protein ACFYNO_10665 [Kitasatospora sp. NPDC006697]|uniref:hypothetical protein n=1 Tax=Kitasatospora sp. NPDC006697 TaxID=3364020 RepID=UPI00367B8D72